MEEENNCPKPDCGRPESAHRWSAGKKLSICGNGHHWNAEAVAEQRRKANDAQAQEVKLDVGQSYTEHFERMKRERLRGSGGPLSGNPFI